MKNILTAVAIALVVCLAVASTPMTAAPQAQAQAAPDAPVPEGLSDLNALTFSCPRAGLNAAARQAAKVPSQGTYQFAYFKIISGTHHAAYEVHFKSNYTGETDLRYCVEMYCQQGWDPKTTQIPVRVMTNERQSTEVMAHGAECGNKQEPAKRRLRR